MALNYETTNWENGKTVLKAEHLRKIEKGITDIIAENDAIYAGEDIRKSNEEKRQEEHSRRMNEASEVVSNIQEDYDSLQRVIIDENISIQLQNQINQANSQIEDNKNSLNLIDTTLENMSNDVTMLGEQLEHIENNLDIATVVLSPEMYGCIGDGLTDDTLNFQQCINDAINKGAMINGLGKTYMISDVQQIPIKYAPAEYGLYIEGSLYLYNCKFVLKDMCSGKTAVINIMNPSGTSVVLDNIYIDGNGTNQSTTITSQDGGLHGLRVGYSDAMATHGCFEIKNSNITNCYSDCICLRPMKFDACRVYDCIISKGGRNGITDNSYISVIENCEFIDNGWRTSPRSGYHIEPDSSFDFGKKTMKNCTFLNSQGDDYKIHFNSQTYNVNSVYIDNCTMTELGIAHYSQNECCIKKLIITNSEISDITVGHGTNATSSFYIENIYINGLIGDLLSIKGSHEANSVNMIVENSSFKTVHFSKGINSVVFNNCIFYKNVFENVDAVRNNCLYFDYDVSGDGYITEQLAFNNCKFYNINRCIMLGTHRAFKNVTLKNNIISTGHLILSQGKDINSLLIDGNIFKDPSGNPGTVGKIRLGEQVKHMLMVNNMCYMSEISIYGDYRQANTVKANNIYDMVE